MQRGGFPLNLLSRGIPKTEPHVWRIGESLLLSSSPESGKGGTTACFASPREPFYSENTIPNSFDQRLLERIEASKVIVKPVKRGYYPGENLEREVFGLDGKILGREKFTIETSQGGGFAGQVFKATPENGVVFYGSQWEKTTPVALKVLRPKKRWKEIFRDLLFKLSYQIAFAPRLREEALRSGLIWQELFRIAAGIEFGTDSAVAKPLGYYWDGKIKSYVEVHQWVDGRGPRYEADDQIITRLRGKTHQFPNSEITRKRGFMHDLVGLCHKIGATGLARQYEWYTFVSQANILTRKKQEEGLSEFVVVDCRPGLAVPFFLPLSPVHTRIILSGLKRGVFAHYDEVDFDRLDAYLAAHPREFEHAEGLIQQLKEDDGHYRSGLPNMWHVRTQLLRDKDLQQKVRVKTIGDWQKLGTVSEESAEELSDGSKKFFPYLILDNLPIVGQPLLSLSGNEKYRQHVGNILRNPNYCREALAVRKAHDVFEWNKTGRITPKRAMTLAISTPLYVLEKIGLSWLPRGLHRFATDAEARRLLAQDSLITPTRLCVNREFRETWLTEIIRQQAKKGLVGADRAEKLKDQIGEVRMRGFVRDLGFTVGLEILAKPFYVLLAAYGVSTRNFWPLVIAALWPISPSGVAREIYVLTQLGREAPHIFGQRDGKLLLTRSLGAACAPWRVAGNIFAPIEMFAYYNDMSLLLSDYFISKIIAAVPILGGNGNLLEHWAFQATYNLPLSIRSEIASAVFNKRSHP